MKKSIILVFVLYSISSFSQYGKHNFRKDINVLHYSINLKIVDFQKKEISGHTVVKFKPNVKNLEEIKLELMKMKIDSIFFYNEKIANFKYNGNILSIPYNQLNKDSNIIELDIHYHGNPVQDVAWGGFFFTDTTAYNIGVGMAAKPNSYGRVWFPCIDSFEEKATFDFNITVTNGYKAVCSGIFESERTNKDGTVTFSWLMNHEVPPYVVSVAIAKYDIIESIYNGIKREIPISLYVFPEDVANTKYSFQNLPNALKTYEHSYGEYVWDRVGYVEVPIMSGAMEHVCNIAYPEYALDSTLMRETLMAHELSHHWFGNLVTCKTSGDMWLNEGLATFSEALFKEGRYGKEAYKDYVRENHVNVLTNAHIYDRAYWALSGVPHEYTYGSTVYDKGGDVAHCLRGYMGDRLFFQSLTEYIKAFSFKAASSYDFRDFLSKFSGIDLTDFFDTWVFTEGFPHFSISHFESKLTGELYRTDIEIKQKLKERDYYGSNNLIDLTFVDKDFNLHTERISMSGPSEWYNFELPYKPLNVFIDLDEKVTDLTVDNFKIFKDTALYDFQYTDFSVLINKLQGKAMIQSIINHIEINDTEYEDFKLSKEKYWDIRGAVSGKLIAEGTFYVNAEENKFDADFDELILFYRPDPKSEFKPLKTKPLQISDTEGLLIVKDLKFGQYVIGIKK